MKGEDTNRKLSREELIKIIKSTASYDGLTLSQEEEQLYRSQVGQGAVPSSVTDLQYIINMNNLKLKFIVTQPRNSKGERAK